VPSALSMLMLKLDFLLKDDCLDTHEAFDLLERSTIMFPIGSVRFIDIDDSLEDTFDRAILV
jgi:hypothetical protein